MKRAQGLQIETIIVAVLLITAVVILLFIMTQRTTTLSKGTFSCEAQGAECVKSASECVGGGRQTVEFDCPTSMPVCCRRQ